VKTIFVSSQRIDGPPANQLVAALLATGVTVIGSPSNPLDSHDPRWSNWYEAGLPEAVRRCSAFVIVVDRGWDSSTWMSIEAEEALKCSIGGRPLPMLFWNPMSLEVKARGMTPYLKRRLPNAVSQAVSQLIADDAA
jgi:hypothetical protein